MCPLCLTAWKVWFLHEIWQSYSIQNGQLLLQFGQNLCDLNGSRKNRHDYIRQSLREFGGQLLILQKNSPIQKAEELIYPANFNHLICAVKQLAQSWEHNPERNTFQRPAYSCLDHHMETIQGDAERMLRLSPPPCSHASLPKWHLLKWSFLTEEKKEKYQEWKCPPLKTEEIQKYIRTWLLAWPYLKKKKRFLHQSRNLWKTRERSSYSLKTINGLCNGACCGNSWILWCL